MSTLLVFGLILFLPLLPCAWRLYALLPISVFQIFLPGLELLQAPVSLAFILASSFWFEFLLECKALVRRRYIFVLLLLALVSLIALFWSVDFHLAFVWLSGVLVFLFVSAGVYRQARKQDKWLVRGNFLLLAAAAFFAASVIIFRLLPLLKMGFLQSGLGGWFINSNALIGLFADSRNNVLDPAKSGGFGFVNANIASSYLGMLAMISIGTGRAFEKRIYSMFGLLLVCVIPFTGSKAGTMLSLPMLALVGITRNGTKGMTNKVLFACAIAVLLTLLSTLLPSFESGMAFGKQVETTTGERALIWRFAAQEFIRNPLFGLGFGGWQLAYPPYARFVGISEGFPPHNTFIYLWAQAGLAAMLVGACFIWEVAKSAFAGLRQRDGVVRGLSMAAGLSAFWLTAQGMGENMGLLGDTHEQIIFSFYLAWSVAVAQQSSGSQRAKHA